MFQVDVLEDNFEMIGHLCNLAPKCKNGKLGLMGSKENERWKAFLSDGLSPGSRYVL